jgi:hypothetical protein
VSSIRQQISSGWLHIWYFNQHKRKRETYVHVDNIDDYYQCQTAAFDFLGDKKNPYQVYWEQVERPDNEWIDERIETYKNWISGCKKNIKDLQKLKEV